MRYKKTSGPRRHTNHNKVWVQLQWGKSMGSITAGDNSVRSYNADVDLCYCYDCKKFSYYDWNAMKYQDISDEYIEENHPEFYAKYNLSRGI